jgi:hypothetical protein
VEVDMEDNKIVVNESFSDEGVSFYDAENF